MRALKETWKTGREAVLAFATGYAFEQAAAVAFYGVLSLAPIIIIMLRVVGTIWGAEAAEREIVDQVEHLIGEQGAGALETLIDQAQAPEGRGFMLLVGIGTLLFSGTAVFAQLQAAMNTIWSVAPQPGREIRHFLLKRLFSLGMLLAISFLMVIALVVSSVINLMLEFLPGRVPTIGWQIMDILIALVVFTLLFAVIFKVLPDARTEWRDIWTGAALTAALFALGKGLIGWMLGRSPVGSAYGAAGSLVILLLWVYYSCLILFLGAEFTQVIARRRGAAIRPEPHAVRVVRKIEQEDEQGERPPGGEGEA